MADKSPFLLTTIDNPYSPFTNWTQWYMEDLRLGYDTCGLVARLSNGNNYNDLSFVDRNALTVIEYNYSGKHVLVSADDFDPFLKQIVIDSL